jgi:hypothetical protein
VYAYGLFLFICFVNHWYSLTKQVNKKITYRILFIGFLSSILFTFFFIRPLNSPWHRFIAGDGLGYYAYLPAQFIYDDHRFEFKWFNAVYAKEYLSSGNTSADEHFLVNHKGKKVNKYYPGLSFLWLPFFGIAHACALVFQFPANGFSLPYQWSIGLASLFYLFLGLFYLRKLIFKFTGKASIALFVPALVFYGTHLFDYAMNMNSLSHVYSFCIISVLAYYSYRFLNEDENRLYHLCVLVFLAVLMMSIRPFNVLALAILPALSFRKVNLNAKVWTKPGFSHILVLAMVIGVILRQFTIMKISTGEFLPNTYQNETFNFLQPELLRSAFGFQYGLFLYAPLLLVSLAGVCFYPGKLKRWILPFLFLFIFYVYSCWWYWPISSRAMIDFYTIPALLLSALLNGAAETKRTKLLAGSLCVLCFYYQIKQIQISRGILDKNYTHAQLYLENFFKLKPTQQFAVPPYSIVKRLSLSNGFENSTFTGPKTEFTVFKGNFSSYLDDKIEYGAEMLAKVPEFYYESGLAKIRHTVYVRAEADMKEFQVYINFKDGGGKQSLSIPFYIKEEELCQNKWVKMEFGHEFSKEELDLIKGNTVQVYIWNSGKKNSLYVDETKLEFFLCDRSAEIVP